MIRELIKKLEIDIHTGSRDKVDQTKWNHNRLHADPFSRIYYIIDGEARIIFKSKELILKKNHMYLLPSKTPLQLLPPETMMEQYWQHFTTKVNAGVTLFDLIDCPVELPDTYFHEPLRTINRLVGLAKTADPGLQLEAQGLLRQLLSPFVTAATHNTGDWSSRLEQLERFQPALDYIESHITELLEIEDIAKRVNLHPTYFSNIFKEKFSISPLKYIITRRLTLAQIMLLNSKKTIKEIALAVGYEDEFYFSRLFRKYIGLSPNTYRAQKDSIQF